AYHSCCVVARPVNSRVASIQGLPQCNQPDIAPGSARLDTATRTAQCHTGRADRQCTTFPYRLKCRALTHYKHLARSEFSMRESNKKPTVLIVLDGWGYREATQDNAIANAV